MLNSMIRGSGYCWRYVYGGPVVPGKPNKVPSTVRKTLK